MKLSSIQIELCQRHPTVKIIASTPYVGTYRCKTCRSDFTVRDKIAEKRKCLCPTCTRNSSRNSHDDFVQKLFAAKGNRTTVMDTYQTANVSLRFKCDEGHIFSAIPRTLLKSNDHSGCRKCRGSWSRERYKFTLDDYLPLLAAKFPRLTVVGNFLRYGKKLLHRCSNGHEFMRSPKMIMSPRTVCDCPICSPGNFSKISQEIISRLERRTRLKFERASTTGEARGPDRMKFDGYNRRFNIVLEYHGDYFHGVKYGRIIDRQKYNATLRRDQLIRDYGFNLITIWGWQYTANPQDCLDRVVAQIESFKHTQLQLRH